jgi:hypothetical protein
VADFTLAVPFLDDSPAFAAGVRLGTEYAAVRRLPARRKRHRAMVAERDEEQMRVMMHGLGWGVAKRESKPDWGDWVFVEYRRP